MNIYKGWKAKLESTYSFMLKYSKITVCRPNTRFLMVQTSDFVNRSGSLEMDFRFIQNKDFETQDLFVPWYLLKI